MARGWGKAAKRGADRHRAEAPRAKGRPPVAGQAEQAVEKAPAGGILSKLFSNKTVNALYTTDAALSMASRAAAFVTPSFYHTVSVEVRGGPSASLTRTWQLAVALAFGQMRYRIGIVSGFAVDAVWDIRRKTVKITTHYDLAYQAALGAREFIRRGPIVETVGAGWPPSLLPVGFANPFALPGNQNNPANPANQGGELVQVAPFAPGAPGGPPIPGVGGGIEALPPANPQAALVGAVVGGRPVNPVEVFGQQEALKKLQNQLVASGLVGQFNILPDDGRLILTENFANPEVQPPRPQDYGDLISLVANALTDPGFLPSSPPDGPRTGNPEGARLYTPGAAVVESRLFGRVAELRQLGPVQAVNAALGIAGAALGRVLRLFGIDGYVKRGRGETVPAIQGPQHEERLP